MSKTKHDHRKWDVYSSHKADWAFLKEDDDQFRFEVREGDRHRTKAWVDPPDVNRSVMADTAEYPVDHLVKVDFEMMIEKGHHNTARWLTLTSLGADEGAPEGGSAPFEFSLDRERLRVQANTEDRNGESVYQKLWRDDDRLERGHWYDVSVEVLIGPKGDGSVDVWIDREHVVDWTGSIGYRGQTSSSWRQGIYRSEAEENIVAHYDGLKISHTDDFNL